MVVDKLLNSISVYTLVGGQHIVLLDGCGPVDWPF